MKFVEHVPSVGVWFLFLKIIILLHGNPLEVGKAGRRTLIKSAKKKIMMISSLDSN